MLRTLLVGLMLVAGAVAQAPYPVSNQPDCTIDFIFSAVAVGTTGTVQYDNRQDGCTVWALAYTSTGFTVEQLEFQSSPDLTGAPSAFVTFAGTLVSGINPNTAITQAESSWTGYYPWVRMKLISVTGTGTVTGKLIGWRKWIGTVAGIVISGGLPAGTACTLQAPFDLSGAGDTQIIALSGSTTIYICHLSFSTTAAEDIKVTRGTGANCATGTANVTGLYKSIQSASLEFGATSPLKGAAAGAICLNQSVAQATGGTVIYAQF